MHKGFIRRERCKDYNPCCKQKLYRIRQKRLCFVTQSRRTSRQDRMEEESRECRRSNTEDRPVASDGNQQYSRNPWHGCCLGLAGHGYIASHHKFSFKNTTGISTSGSSCKSETSCFVPIKCLLQLHLPRFRRFPAPCQSWEKKMASVSTGPPKYLKDSQDWFKLVEHFPNAF